MGAKSDESLKKRLSELAARSFQNGVFLFTDFLSAGDAGVAYQVASPGEISLFGGAAGCERVIVRFGDPAALGYEVLFPISVLRIEPLQKKFADALSHRDFLGALMNLGIERDVIGDILVRDACAYVFAAERIAGFISENLFQVKHTSVRVRLMEEAPAEASPVLERAELIVPSLRLDGVLAKLYHLSRQQAKALFPEGQVLLNGRLCVSPAAAVKENDVLSVRGHGKFIFRGFDHETRKGNCVVVVEKYV